MHLAMILLLHALHQLRSLLLFHLLRKPETTKTAAAQLPSTCATQIADAESDLVNGFFGYFFKRTTLSTIYCIYIHTYTPLYGETI